MAMCVMAVLAGAVPMLLVGREPDDVAGVNFFDRPALALGQAGAGGHDEGLAQWMRVPRRSSAGLECYAAPATRPVRAPGTADQCVPCR